MTKLNKVIIQGFKSFQRKTVIPFFEGMTAIVGENGSGKSNIVEAIQFVLGKRSSNLRAEKMEHLIFNGGNGRKPSEFAEVTLFFDNSSGKFDEFLDEHKDEITIGRKITRSYSTYKFMGKNCQRDLIDRILKKMGIDSEHNFIKQEEITSIIKKSPIERRKIIDDVAGISHYEDRKNKALAELEEVENKLREKEILLEEKKSYLNKLLSEKETAEKYLNLEEEKRLLDISLLLVRKNHLENSLEGLKEKYQKIIEKTGKEELEIYDEKINELEKKIEELDKKIIREEGKNIVKEIEEIKASILRKKDEIEMKKREIDSLNQSIEEIERLRRLYEDRNEIKSIKEIMNLNLTGVYGKLHDLCKIPERFSTAISVALGSHKNDIVVENRDIALKCIDYLKRNNLGRLRFLPLDKLFPPKPSLESRKALQIPGVIDYAINLINFDRKFEKAFRYALQDTLVAENLESMKNVERVPIVTLDGDYMSRGGAITGGSKLKVEKKGKSIYDISEKKEKIVRLENEIEEIKKEIGTLNELLERKNKERENYENRSDNLWQERKKLNEELERIREERMRKYMEISNLQSELKQLESSINHFETELKQIDEEISEFETIPMDKIKSFLSLSVEDIKRKRSNLVRKLNSFGPVNMRAIEDYEIAKKEYEDFQNKVNIIKNERNNIYEMIEELEEKKKERFFKILHEISTKFNQIFQELFNGGESSLHLHDSDDINSGLIIKAHPPGKKPHTIDSLSGGEKTLTAIAFMIAIQEFRKSPLYIMDEIDAQLDEENALKVSKLLKKYSQNSQLILISHNQETIRNADRVYGVTMVDGVSKIRSIDLNENS